MITDMTEQNQLELLYETSAKPLYRLAICTVGDSRLAEQAAAGVFLDAYRSLSGACDCGVFLRRCFSLLYAYGKQVWPESVGISPADTGMKALERMLLPLSFDEKYILLLFCRQKYSIRQIAEITGLPGNVVERHLSSAAVKTAGMN